MPCYISWYVKSPPLPPPPLGPPMHTSVQQMQQVGRLLVKHLLKADPEAVSDSLTGTV